MARYALDYIISNHKVGVNYLSLVRDERIGCFNVMGAYIPYYWEPVTIDNNIMPIIIISMFVNKL